MQWSFITKDKGFRGFFWTQFLGAFNDNFFKNALVVLVAFRGVSLLGLESGALVAVASGLLMLPFFLFSPLAGQLADKYERSALVRKVKLLEVVIMIAAALGFIMKSYLILLGLIFFMGLQSTFFGPIKYSIIPDLVGDDHLTEGNALTELGTFLSILMGTIGGGIATSLPGADIVIGIVLVVVSLMGYWMSRAIPTVAIGDPQLEIDLYPWKEYRSLWRLLREKVAIFNAVLAISWFWFFGAGVLSVLPVYVKDYLHGNENVVTLFLAMFTLGVGVGSILCEKFSYGRSEIGLVPVGSAGLSLFLFDLYLVGAPWASLPTPHLSLPVFLSSVSGWHLMFDFFMMSVFGGIFIVPLYTLLQERSHPQSRSRIIAANNIMNAIFMVLATVVLLLFYKLKFNPVEIFAAFAAMNLLSCFYIYSVVPEFTLRFYSWVLSRLIYSIQTTGIKNVPEHGPYILVANHVSFVDWLIIGGACKRPVSFIMYYKFFQIPFARFFMKQAKVIAIASKDENEQLMNEAFQRIGQQFNRGEGVCIFPEGMITEDGRLNKFRPGLLKILQSHPVPVVPVVLHGLWGSIFSRKPIKDPIHRRQLQVKFLPAIPAQDVTLDGLQDLFSKQLS